MTKYMKEELREKVSIIEIDESCFQQASQFSVDGICADLERLNEWFPFFAGKKYDYILFADVLEHLRNPLPVLTKATALLKDDGEVILSVPNVAHADIMMRMCRDEWNYTEYGLLDNTHIRFWGQKNLPGFLEKAGLSPVEMDYVIRAPFWTEQATHEWIPQQYPMIYALCSRERADIYQTIVFAKKSEFTAEHNLSCLDHYYERHQRYGGLPAFLEEYAREQAAKENQLTVLTEAHIRERAAWESQVTMLANAQKEMVSLHEKAMEEHNRMLSEHLSMEVKHRRDFEAWQEELALTKAELANTQVQLQQAWGAYYIVSNAFFWRVTKPLRALADLIKKVFHRRAEAPEAVSLQITPEPTVKEQPLYTPGDPITILATKHTLFVAKLIRSALERLDIPTIILTEQPLIYGNELHIIICPQMFSAYPDKYISFQMEQTVSSRWLTSQYLDTLEHSVAVLDYSTVNIQYFRSNVEWGKMLYYLPLDYCRELASGASGGDYKYDVTFYGDIQNIRRKAILDELSKDFRVHIVSEVFGDELYEELSKSKVVINLHYYENALLETTRLYEVLSLGRSIVLSERSSDPEEEERLEGIVDFIKVNDVAAMKEHLSYWLTHEDCRIKTVAENTRLLRERSNAFDYYFYRFLLAQDWLSFDRFYELAGDFISFHGNRICLSLPEDVERRKSFKDENKFGFQVFPGLRHKRSWTGCGLSYKFIMRKAKEQAMPEILVCEDDVVFPEEFTEKFNECQSYLETHPGWDIFQGLMADVQKEKISRVDHGKRFDFISLDHMISMVFNLYRETIYDLIIAWDERNDDVQTNTIDRALEKQNLRIVTTVPFVVGHKEDLNSTIWGFKNTQYSNGISASSLKLAELAEKFEKDKGQKEEANSF